MSNLLASAALACAFPLPAAPQQITGAGATFPAPVYTKWGEAAKAATGVELNYQAIGSGGGQNQILSRTVDFGASDAPMDPAKLQSGNLVQFPMVMGAVVPIVNLPGVAAEQLKPTGDVLAEINAGKITKWNDPKLTELNPGATLPSFAIALVHRATPPARRSCSPATCPRLARSGSRRSGPIPASTGGRHGRQGQ